MSRDKQNIKTTDWLTRGMTEAELAKTKEEAIKEAEAELRDKQIEEMAKDLGIAFQLAGTTRFGAVAEVLVNAGYRKIYDDHQRQCTCYALGCQMAEELKKEVAREIFEELEKFMSPYRYPIIAELKKKYTEEVK